MRLGQAGDKMRYVQGVSLRALQPSRLSLAFSRSDFYNKRTISANPLKKFFNSSRRNQLLFCTII